MAPEELDEDDVPGPAAKLPTGSLEPQALNATVATPSDATSNFRLGSDRMRES
jgi:hypothetical protein